MSKSKLKKDLGQKLNNLDQLVEKIRNTEINSEEEENWDYDYYSELLTNLENALELLKGKTILGKVDEFSDPIVLEKGILTLLTEWEGENNEDDEEE